MGFRRKKQDVKELRRWRRFVLEHRELLRAAGFPELVLDDFGRFAYFAMHGEHPECPHSTLPAPGELDERTRRALRELIALYAAAGLPNPGFALLGEDDNRSVGERP